MLWLRKFLQKPGGKEVFAVYVICLVPITALLTFALLLVFARVQPSISPEVAAKIASHLWINPMPRPGFLSSLDLTTTSTGALYSLCALLDYRKTTNAVYTAGQYKQISSSVQIEIDGFGVSKEYSGDLQIGWQTICVAPHNLSAGLHLAKLSWATPSGQKREYSWAFKLMSQNGVMKGYLPVISWSSPRRRIPLGP